MKLLLLAMVLASMVTLGLARVGDPERLDEDQSNRRLCGTENKGCTFLLNSCCSGFSCHINGKCYSSPRQESDPCLPWMSECDDGLTCDITQLKCRRMGTAVDDSCNFSRPCSGNLECDMKINKCRLPGGFGEYCHATRPCGVGLECQGVTGATCQYPGLEDQSCSVTRGCAPGLTCDLTSSICREPSPWGGPCHLSRVCMSGLGLYCDLDSQTCKTALGVGEPCSTYVPCADDLWCDTVTDTCEEIPSKCELGGEDCDDSDIGDLPTGSRPNVNNNGTGVICNMATGGCIPETPAPTNPPTTISPTDAPTNSSSPTEAPTPPTASPTMEETPKCPLTGCVMDEVPLDVDESLVPEDRTGAMSKASGKKGRSNHSHKPGPGGRRELGIEANVDA